MIIGHASAEDLAAILDPQRQNRLPVEGLAAHLATTVIAHEEGRIVGIAALELHCEYAVLRDG